MIQKKVCMLGTTAVGKTSLVRRFVTTIFDDSYLTTLGVKTDSKSVQINGKDVTLVLWDIHGADEFQSLRKDYLRGMHGYLLVADGTRKSTVDDALAIYDSIKTDFAKVPFIFLVNKVDLKDEWEFESDAENQLIERGWTVMRSSAKTGESVEAAFETLTQKML
jgi:small GTP-binding protein